MLKQPLEPKPKVVIIGAGFGGLSAARALSGKGVSVVVIDRQNHHLFQPLLYQVATAALSPAEIAVPVRHTLAPRKNGDLQVLMDEVTGVDPAGKYVRTRDGAEQRYDYLILATGARYSYFGHPEWQDPAPSLKSLDDATGIRRRILLALEQAETATDPARRETLMTFVVVGGGPTGVEMAGAIAELVKASLARDFSNISPEDARVVLVEAGDRLLAGYSPRLQRYALLALGRIGVEVRLGAPVEDITFNNVMAGGKRISAATTIWCAGVEATPVAAWLGVDPVRGGGVPVTENLWVPDDPDIFVIGDAAAATGPDGKPYPALAPVAKQQGEHAARTILCRVNGQPEPDRFRYRDWGSMATIGRSAAVGSFGRVEVTGFPAWLLWGAVHITYLIGFRNRLVVLVDWIWAWFTYAKGARLITGRSGSTRAAVQPDENEKG